MSLQENMTFGEALRLLKNGKRVARTGWDRKNMFLFLVGGSEDLIVNCEPLISILGQGAKFTYQPHVDMFTADGTIVPWLCSQSDMIAEDWFTVPNQEPMRPHEKRVIEEAEELADKISKLGTFIKSLQFDELPHRERELLSIQKGIMTNYHGVLIKRIALFNA